jgi:hypothetical protein
MSSQAIPKKRGGPRPGAGRPKRFAPRPGDKVAAKVTRTDGAVCLVEEVTLTVVANDPSGIALQGAYGIIVIRLSSGDGQ